jgi:O-antigen ligase
LVAALAAACAVSIFAAQALMAVAALVLLARLLTGQARMGRLAVDGPLLAFVVWTLLSASFSPEPLRSYEAAKKLVLFAVFYLALDTAARPVARERMLLAALLGTLALSGASIVQYFALGFDTLDRRPRGFLGHYMTAAGIEAAGLVLAAAFLLFGREARPTRRDLWLPLGVLAALLPLGAALRVFPESKLALRLFVAGLVGLAGWIAWRTAEWPGRGALTAAAVAVVGASSLALVLSQTRNAWLGALVGLGVLCVVRAPRTLVALGALVALLLALRPEPLVRRLTVTDASSIDRYYMWQAGFDMVRDKPVFGQGPGMILARYPSYRWLEARNANQPHLHDNALQIAAERGLPALGFWAWIMAALLLAAVREARGRKDAWPAAAALGTLAGLLAAGIFEYNFGDSEVLMLCLLVAALPFALRRERDARLGCA